MNVGKWLAVAHSHRAPVQPLTPSRPAEAGAARQGGSKTHRPLHTAPHMDVRCPLMALTLAPAAPEACMSKHDRGKQQAAVPWHRSRSRPLALAATVLALALLTGCAPMPVLTSPPFVWDSHFAPVPLPDAEQVFALSPAMRDFAAGLLKDSSTPDLRQRLLDALLKGPLALRYDDSRSRTAAEAFDERQGNCLSLTILTAAFARRLGLPVAFQQVDVDETYARHGGLFLTSHHVNVVLQRPFALPGPRFAASYLRRSSRENADWTVDFLPGRAMAGARIQPLSELTVQAMYLNNRAAEMLGNQASPPDLNRAYAWAKAAVRRDPGFAPARNTLGVVYHHAGLLEAAQTTYQQALLIDRDNVSALQNLASSLRQLGRMTEARQTERRLSELQPQAPFADYDHGRAAMALGNYPLAETLFSRELRLQPYQSDVHFWAAMAQRQLGNWQGVEHHLRQALAYSNSASERQRFDSKLAQLRALRAEKSNTVTPP